MPMLNGPLGLEHPLVVTDNIDDLAERFRKLGFASTRRGFHPWGTATQLVLFPNNFIELMGIADPDLLDEPSETGFRFGRFIARQLDRREGVAMVALHSDDMHADIAKITARGLEPDGLVNFRRAVTLTDGAQDEAVVSLAMLTDEERPRLSYFLCQQHRPELVWVPAWMDHPNGAEAITFPDGGVTPFKGQKGEAWEGGYRAPLVIRWPGHIKPGTVKDQMFAALDWLPTLVDIAGGPKGDGLKKQIEAGQYPNIVKTTLDGLDQRDYLEGKSEKSARDYFFYYSGSTPSAVRINNWKIYYTMSKPGGAGWLEPLTTYHFPLIQNIKRDPFEQFVDPNDSKSLLTFGGTLAAPSTAFMYSGLGIMPLGQQLWLKELESYKTYPPLQAPETYNLTQVIQEVQKMHSNNPSD